MKKVLTIMMIAVIAVSSVFAASGYLGVSSGYSFNFDLEETKKDTYSTIPVWIDGATYFGKKDMKFGVSYGAELVDITLEPVTSAEKTVTPYAGLAFKYNFGKTLGLGVNLNATYKWGVKVGAYHVLGVMGDLFLNINAGSFNIKVGANASGDVAGWLTNDGNALNVSDKIPSAMRLTPYVGIGYAY